VAPTQQGNGQHLQAQAGGTREINMASEDEGGGDSERKADHDTEASATSDASDAAGDVEVNQDSVVAATAATGAKASGPRGVHIITAVGKPLPQPR
jgi:hypothetical protein